MEVSTRNARVQGERCDGNRDGRADRNEVGQSDQSPTVSRLAASSPPRLSPSKSCASIRFSLNGQRRGNQEAGLLLGGGKERKTERHDQKREEENRARSEALATAESEAIIAGGMRRGSEVASWAVCGTTTNSSRGFLW